LRLPPRSDTSGTEVFEAASVDLALRAARAAHGPDVQVVRALRVVAGVRGLLGQARYQVLVRPPVPVQVVVLPDTEAAAPAPAEPVTGGDPLRSALDDLLDAADARERGAEAGPPDIVEEDSGWSWAQQQEVDRLLADLDARVGTAASPHPALEMAAHETPPPLLPQDDDEWAEVEDAPGSGWDRDELRRLGVPAAVLSRLPVEDPSDDAGWRRALQGAIEAVVPAPSKADAQHPVVVSGHGLLGVVAVLRAAVEDGLTPGTISFDGRRRPANPAALVDVLAAVVRS
jgi:hypothetical protein